nr:MAG TPA: hypothetical protein [Caudoviricetes sp.]
MILINTILVEVVVKNNKIPVSPLTYRTYFLIMLL